jgi:hypothetical protein
MRLDLQLPMQSVPITTKVVSLNPAHVKVYSIQYYMTKFVSDLQQVGGGVYNLIEVISINSYKLIQYIQSRLLKTNELKG